MGHSWRGCSLEQEPQGTAYTESKDYVKIGQNNRLNMSLTRRGTNSLGRGAMAAHQTLDLWI